MFLMRSLNLKVRVRVRFLYVVDEEFEFEPCHCLNLMLFPPMLIMLLILTSN